MKKLILLILFIPFITGCFNYRELNDIRIVQGFAVEKTENGIKVSAQLLNPKKSGGDPKQTQNQQVMLEAEDKTFFSALRRMTLESDQKLYISHVQIMIIDEDIAKDGLENWIDFIIRDNEFRTEFKILMAKDSKPSDILKTQVALADYSAKQIDASLETSDKWFGISKLLTFDEFVSEFLEEGIEPSMNGISLINKTEEYEDKENIESSTPGSIIKLQPLAVFREDKFVGWLNEEETVGYSLATNQIKNTIITVPCEDNYIGIETTSSKAKITTYVKDNKIRGSIKVNVTGVIEEVNCKMKFHDEKTIEDIAKDAEKYIKNLINKGIIKIQEYKSDILGFGEVLHKSNHKHFNKIKDEWNNIFATMPIEIKVSVELPKMGVTIERAE